MIQSLAPKASINLIENSHSDRSLVHGLQQGQQLTTSRFGSSPEGLSESGTLTPVELSGGQRYEDRDRRGGGGGAAGPSPLESVTPVVHQALVGGR